MLKLKSPPPSLSLFSLTWCSLFLLHNCRFLLEKLIHFERTARLIPKRSSTHIPAISSTPNVPIGSNSDSIIRETKAILKSREKKTSHSKVKQVQRPVAVQQQGRTHSIVDVKTIAPRAPKVTVEHKNNHTQRKVEPVVKSEGPRKLLMSDSSMSSDQSDSEGELKIYNRSPSTLMKGGKKGSKFKKTAPDGGLFVYVITFLPSLSNEWYSYTCLHVYSDHIWATKM